MGILDRARSAWNAFASNDPYREPAYPNGVSTSYGSARPDRRRSRSYNDRTILTSILVRIAVDVSGVVYRHVEVNPDTDRFVKVKQSRLNDALTIESNLDQGPRAFRQDIVMTMLDTDSDGVVAIVPVDVLKDAETGEITDILTLRAGTIVAWKPKHVRVSLYNEATARQEEIWLEKRYVAIVENPFRSVMNQPNSTLQRLARKLNLLDQVAEQSASGKLDLIIQLPYTINTETKREHAKQRREDIEEQLTGSTYGIAYADAAEKIVQLNRPIENDLLKQVEYLTGQLYDQMGVTKGVMDGSADEAAMLNYFDRTIEPFADAIAEGMRRTFAPRKSEKIAYYRNLFKLVPLSALADIIDKIARNEVVTSNEIRVEILGLPPHEDAKADMLVNSNMPSDKAGAPTPTTGDGQPAQLQKGTDDEE